MGQPEAPADSVLAVDPDTILLRDPGILLDPRFVSALHVEMARDLDAGQADALLVQIGFLHGLRDALRAAGTLGTEHAAGSVGTPSFSIQLAMNRFPEQRGAIEVNGTWPDRREAEALLAAGVRPGCTLSAGYTSGWLSGMFDANVLALETSCCATGEQACCFVAREAEAWRSAQHAGARDLLDVLPFDQMRERVIRELEGEEYTDATPGSFDRDAAVVHIWGPVMVIPFSGPDEALRAVELIGNDPGARDVSVLVVDLRGAIVDEAFGAAALERIIDSAEDWGVETLFAEVSPLSEPVVADLAHPPLMVHKDLEQAIAAAFQIARSQRTSV